MKGRMREQSIASYTGKGDCAKKKMAYEKKKDLGTSDENILNSECSQFSR